MGTSSAERLTYAPWRLGRWDGSAFGRPLANLGLGIVFAVGLAVALARFLPRGWLWDRMILASAVGGAAQVAGAPAEARASLDALVGQRGVAVTGLFPSGQVEIAGQRYEARIELGHAEPGTPIVVRGRQDFALIVEKTAAA